MASKVINADNWMATIDSLARDAEGAASVAVYGGASVIADGLREAIGTLPSQTGDGRRRRGITDDERAGLLSGLGVAQHQKGNGVVNTKIGFTGYNAYVTRKYPNGHPNSMVARSIESGTSWLTKTPFIAPTVRRLRASTVEAMQTEMDKFIREKE